jgi:preprotein translocase subunit SecE
MNVKAENVGTSVSAGDIVKYVIAALIAAGGIAVYYLFPQWYGPIRGLIVLFGFAAAIAVMALTALGRQGRGFLSEALFELRKVVWPTKVEARNLTGVVLLMVLAISLILATFDFIISQLVKLLLGH